MLRGLTLRRSCVYAQTCDNILELPNYWDALAAVHLASTGRAEHTPASLAGNERAVLAQQLRAHLRDKLLLAIHHADGYELDDIPAAGSPYRAPALALASASDGSTRGASRRSRCTRSRAPSPGGQSDPEVTIPMLHDDDDDDDEDVLDIPMLPGE